MANIAQLVERQIVALDAVGSNPAIRPKENPPGGGVRYLKSICKIQKISAQVVADTGIVISQ